MADTSSASSEFECDYSSGEEAYNYNIDVPFYRGVERKILPADVVPLVLRCVSTVKDYSSAGSVSRAWRSAARRLSAGGDSVSLVLEFVRTEEYFSAGSVSRSWRAAARRALAGGPSSVMFVAQRGEAIVNRRAVPAWARGIFQAAWAFDAEQVFHITRAWSANWSRRRGPVGPPQSILDLMGLSAWDPQDRFILMVAPTALEFLRPLREELQRREEAAAMSREAIMAEVNMFLSLQDHD